jgi:S-formylglutathione hydrolase FrmB
MELAGRIVVETVEFTTLRDNPLGDPATRSIPVYLPPAYESNGARPYPVIYWLHGFGGTALSQVTLSPWLPTPAEQLDRLIREGAPAAIMVMADGWTTYGGSQYLNSSASGRYEDAVRELITHIDRCYRTLPAREHRGLDGKSSGGYGALALGMRHPELFGAIASHSGDLYFEACFMPGFWGALDTVRQHGSLQGFLTAFRAAPKKTEAMTRALGTLVAMAMAYSPNPSGPDGFDLPVNFDTGELREDVWRRWTALDPVRMVEVAADGLRGMGLIYFECGTRDQYHSQYGGRILHRRMEHLGIRHEYQEFDDDHTGVNYRYVESLRRLCAALAP